MALICNEKCAWCIVSGTHFLWPVIFYIIYPDIFTWNPLEIHTLLRLLIIFMVLLKTHQTFFLSTVYIRISSWNLHGQSIAVEIAKFSHKIPLHQCKCVIQIQSCMASKMSELWVTSEANQLWHIKYDFHYFQCKFHLATLSVVPSVTPATISF